MQPIGSPLPLFANREDVLGYERRGEDHVPQRTEAQNFIENLLRKTGFLHSGNGLFLLGNDLVNQIHHRFIRVLAERVVAKAGVEFVNDLLMNRFFQRCKLTVKRNGTNLGEAALRDFAAPSSLFNSGNPI